MCMSVRIFSKMNSHLSWTNCVSGTVSHMTCFKCGNFFEREFPRVLDGLCCDGMVGGPPLHFACACPISSLFFLILFLFFLLDAGPLFGRKTTRFRQKTAEIEPVQVLPPSMCPFFFILLFFLTFLFLLSSPIHRTTQAIR